ncbi:MAG: NAD(P)-dependent oxidoreductase [Xanthobacteraceae bacterium]|nr:NAD(P)-dependent oxidoreductase [Xanthobacteraceae bacterium]
MTAVFVDANDSLAAVFERLSRIEDPPLRIHRDPDVAPEALPGVLGDAAIAIVDHTYLPTAIARRCAGLRHVVFLGTGARSYMDPEELAAIGIQVHIIKGYGDTAVAEAAIALMWASARNIALMDREMRTGAWLREDGLQLTGKTLGLVGFGGIGAEVARIAAGSGMTVLAWNRTPKAVPNVSFTDLDHLLAASDVVSLHLLLTDDTRGLLSRERIGRMKRGAILINTARGALVDEAAMIEALRAGQLRHAGLDVFDVEPLPVDHPLTKLPNVTLSAHSAFRTPEASDNLVEAALQHCRRIASAP